MKFLGRGLLVAITALLLTSLGFAQYSNDIFATADPDFMKDAAQDAMAKIHLAYLALQNAQNEQVRAFAQQILNDYGQTQAALFNLANQQSVVLPNTLDSKNQETFEALSTLQGEAFDKAYMKAMLNQDQTALARFKQEATKGNGWAKQALPTLESDLKTAEKVAPAVGVPAKATSGEQHTPSAGKPANTASQKP